MEAQLTFGQEAVGLTFNPSGDPKVVRLKQLFADAIDEIRNDNVAAGTTKAALQNEAVVKAIDAQMWAVKVATWKVD